MKSEFRKIVSKVPILQTLSKYRARYIWKSRVFQDPRKNANRVYREVFGKDINWENPKDLIEKIYWLEMYSDISQWTLCADKYGVRRYVESKGCSDILNTLYGKWNKSEDIDYSTLPNSFVLKTTNGCGQILLVEDKSQLDIHHTNALLDEWMQLKYGYTDGQVHYSHIKPCIIAEKLLKMSNLSAIIDYKIWCFHGTPEFILVVHERVLHGEDKGYKLSVYNLNWENISVHVLNDKNVHVSGDEISCPKHLDLMIEKAKILSEDFLEARIDFYEIEDKVILSEITFSTGYGYFKESFYKQLGNKIDLTKAKLIKGVNRPPQHS